MEILQGEMNIFGRVIFIETANEFYKGSYQIKILYLLNPLISTRATFGDFQVKIGNSTHFYEMSQSNLFDQKLVEFVKPSGLLSLQFSPDSITLFPGTYIGKEICIKPVGVFK